MARIRSVRGWTLAVASAFIFVVFSSADQIVRAIAPAGQQDPPTPPPQQQQEQDPTAGRGNRGGQKSGDGDGEQTEDLDYGEEVLRTRRGAQARDI